jgi:putative transposase
MSYQKTTGVGESFSLLLAPFLQAPGLPFANVLSEKQIEEAFAAEGVCFGKSKSSVYTGPITLWAFLSQVLHTGELRSCTAAVARVIVLLVSLGREPCATDTGAYCRARARLPEKVIQRLALDVGNQLQRSVPADWLWHGRYVKLVDGTTVTMPDTPANQEAYPQQKSQKPGLGFPIMRMVLLLSLATAAACGVAFAPYAGKQTGEPALLRGLLDQLHQGDILLGDRYYCSYFLLALALQRKVDGVVRLHQRRRADFRRGRCLARYDRLIEWHRPQRPEWMDPATYASIPKTLCVRQILVEVHQPGFRVEKLVVVTTLVDKDLYPTRAIAELYHYRWNAELDIRAIKQSMTMDHLRCKTPAMVHKEIWTHWLAYNLIRKTIAQAALLKERLPRQISFAGARQTIVASWDQLSGASAKAVQALAPVQFAAIATHKVGHRPNRVEPRAIKRRPKPHRLLKKPRSEAREELIRKHPRGR